MAGRLGNERLQRHSQLTGQHHLAAMAAAEQAIRTEISTLEGMYRKPTQMFLEKASRPGLNHLVLGTGVGIDQCSNVLAVCFRPSNIALATGSSSLRNRTKTVLPLSRHGVTRASKVSPVWNFAPPPMARRSTPSIRVTTRIQTRKQQPRRGDSTHGSRNSCRAPAPVRTRCVAPATFAGRFSRFGDLAPWR